MTERCNNTPETTPTFIGTADADTNIELFVDRLLGTTTTDSDGDWSFSVQAVLHSLMASSPLLLLQAVQLVK